jgi:hypothetical protein
MRSVVRSFGIAGVILMLAGVHNASAQVIGSVEFTTSFPFTVGYATVPAGSYAIVPDDDNPELFELTGRGTAVLFEARTAEVLDAPSKTEVVFKRYGDAYVLKDVWMEGNRIGAETVAVEGEKHMAKQADASTEHRVAARKTAAAPASVNISSRP